MAETTADEVPAGEDEDEDRRRRGSGRAKAPKAAKAKSQACQEGQEVGFSD